MLTVTPRGQLLQIIGALTVFPLCLFSHLVLSSCSGALVCCTGIVLRLAEHALWDNVVFCLRGQADHATTSSASVALLRQPWAPDSMPAAASLRKGAIALSVTLVGGALLGS